MYDSRLNYSDIAYILYDKVAALFMDSEYLQTSNGDIDVEAFTRFLDEGFNTEALNELLASEFGKGMVMGAYLEHQMHQARMDEAAMLEELAE